MAVSYFNNSARVIQLPPKTISRDLQINVGVVVMRRASMHIGWRLVAAAVRRYRTLSPVARGLLRALAIALIAATVIIRLIAIFE